MSTREESHEVNDPRIPKGYSITYHEVRGYDSPDRWHTAWRGGNQKLGDFGSFADALKACLERAERQPMRVGSVKTLRPWKLRIHRSNDRVTLHYGTTAIPLSYEAAEELKNLLEKADSAP